MGPELRPHSPESYLTSCSPITYDEEANAPLFDTAVRGILSFSGGEPMPDQDEMLRHVEELLGYTIQTRRNLKVFVLIVGPGDNGKTRIVKLIQLILGTDAIAFDRLAGVDEDGNRFATSRLIGKQAIIDDDVDADYLLPDGMLKKIAEEKPLTAEAKFKDAISFIAQVVPWLLGNSWPKTRDLSRGMQTRAQVLYSCARGSLPICIQNAASNIVRSETSIQYWSRLLSGFVPCIDYSFVVPPQRSNPFTLR